MSTNAVTEAGVPFDTIETHSLSENDPMEAVQTVSLPPVVSEFADAYDEQVGDRDPFLWRWIYSLFPSFELASVSDEYVSDLRIQKTLLTIYVTVVDDLVENHGDEATFEEARQIPFDASRVRIDRPDVNGEVLGYLADLWIELDKRMRDAPHYEDFADLFQYDLRQTLNAVSFGQAFTENPAIANRTGYFRYASHNMCMFPYSDLDLMHAPEFDQNQLGTLRATLWDVQELARIGNDLTTWEREIGENDFASGIVVQALEEGVVSVSDLERPVDGDALIQRIRGAGIEDEFADEWVDQYQSALDRAERTNSVDVVALVTGMKTVFQYHLASRGKK